MMKFPTCFVRRVSGREELLFLAAQEKRICNTIKKYNKKNEIVFVVPKYIYELEPIESG